MGEMTVFGAGSPKGLANDAAARATPVEAPDSLQAVATARMLMLMGMGQHAGPPAALAQCVFLDGVPLENADGTRNFERVVVEWRPGTQYQERVAGFSDVEAEVSVAAEVKAATPLVRLIDDVTATAVRVTVSTAALLSIDASGNTNPTAVSLAVDIKPAVGAWVEVGRIDINGKTRSRYQKARRFALAGTGPWQVRVRRITPDSTTQNLQNATSWDSFTVINETPLRYPNSALLALKFDAKAFSSMPKIEARWRLNLLQVPSNYDAASRTYSGPWDGTFKPAVSNSPAWWLYTYLTDPRFNIGLPDGEYKWDLYRIAQWCDQLVSDGQGGLRPRFTANMVQTETADPWAIVQDIASIFCGRVIPYAGGVRVVADMPCLSPRKHFVPANVEGGRFVYGDSELKDRHTSAVVTFRDKADRYQNAVELVEHADGYLRYGHNPVDVVGVGIDNRAQAQQLGRYVLETAQAETGTVSFGAGIYALDLLPGDVFEIADPVEAGARYGGRLMSVDGTAVVLDAPVELAAGVAYSLEVPLPDGTLQRRGVNMLPGNYTALQVVAPFSQQPVEGTTWLLVATTVQPTLWRCVSNAQVGGDPFHRSIAGVQHDPDKWTRIEQGIRLAPLPVSSLPDPSSPPAVVGVVVREVDYLRPDGARAVRLDVDWPASSFAFLRGYVVSYRQAGGNWVELPEVSANHDEIADVLPGQWQVRVAAVSVTGARSVSAPLDVTAAGSTRKPALPALTASGGAMRVDLTIGWPSADCVRAELFGSALASDPAPAKLCDLAYPASTWAHLGMATGVTMYYWLRVYSSWGVASDFAQASATTIKDPSILLQQLQGAVGRGALDALVGGSIDQVPSLTALRDVTVPALAGQMSQLAPALADLQQRVIPQLNAAGEAAAEAALRLVLDADKRAREARRNRRVLDAIIDVDPATGQIRLKATAEITTDVDAKIRDVLLLADALDGRLTGTVTTVNAHGGRLSAAESQLQLLETQISLGVQQALAYTDTAVSSNANGLADVQRQLGTLSETQLRAALAADEQRQAARGLKVSLAQAKLDIKANADELAAQASATLTLASRLGAAEAGLLVEQQVRSAADQATASQLGAMQAVIDSNGAAISDERSVRATADAALGQRIDTVQAVAADNASAITATQTALADQARAQASRSDALQADYTRQADAAGNAALAAALAADKQASAARGTRVSVASLTRQQQATADALQAEVVVREQLAAQVGAVSAAVQSESVARSTADTALGQRIDTVQAAAAANAAAIQSETTARATADTALGQRIDTVQASAAANSAAIQSEATARASAEAALSQRIDTVQAAAAGAIAAVQEEASARATAVGAEAMARQLLAVRVGEAEASVAEQAEVVDGLKAQKTLRVTAGGKIAGWAAYADANASAFDILADVFRVSLPNGSGSRQVFTVGSLNGGPAVGIAGDLILDGAMAARHVSADAANFVLLQAKSIWAQTGYIGALSELTANAGIVISGRLQNGPTLAASTAVIDLNARGSQPFLQVINRDSGRQDVLVTADGYVQVARQVVSEPDIRAAAPVGVDSGWLEPGAVWSYIIDTGYQSSTVWSDAASEQLVGAATISGGMSQNGGGTGLMQVDVLTGDGLSLGGGGYVDGRVYLKVTYQHAGAGQIRITQLKWKLARV
ncbi:TipJ family phage tail tip protein [Vogesella urethralis]|uniref:TipJ family phage tail tip protein n=1 Tax=Vogesella urethralis TaxID=2592656 RepID=UPI0011871BEA|nr:phage tail protein [Vogesella urethralis]